jgi:hypothetical protein
MIIVTGIVALFAIVYGCFKIFCKGEKAKLLSQQQGAHKGTGGSGGVGNPLLPSGSPGVYSSGTTSGKVTA